MSRGGSSKKGERIALDILQQEIKVPVLTWPGRKNVFTHLASIATPNDIVPLLKSDHIASSWGGQSPDAYFVIERGTQFLDWNPDMHHLCMVEVEVTSPMTERKIETYGWTWDYVTSESLYWDFHLIIFPKYQQYHLINLRRFYDKAFSTHLAQLESDGVAL